MSTQTHSELTGQPLFTTCSCTDGQHYDLKALTRGHVSEVFAGIIARHTGRHVVPVGAIRTEAAA
jgi:hypothetical protein